MMNVDPDDLLGKAYDARIVRRLLADAGSPVRGRQASRSAGARTQHPLGS